MKHFLTLLLLAGILFSCSENGDNQSTDTTSLELTLKNEDGNIITDGTGYARLYPTVDDWSRDTNQIGEPAFADLNGKITFTNLAAQKYYWRVENGCRTNFTTSITTPQPLEANTTNSVDVPLTTTFTLRLRKDPAYENIPFMVYINGNPTVTISGGPDIRDLLHIPPHSTVRILQLNDVPNPIDVTYTNVDGDCGETITINYPN